MSDKAQLMADEIANAVWRKCYPLSHYKNYVERKKFFPFFIRRYALRKNEKI